MTKGAQNVGFDELFPVVRGSKVTLVFNVTPLVEGEVASATYRFLDANPKVPGANLVFSKTTGSGITFADGAIGVDFTVVIDKADFDPLYEQRYYHDLTVVKTNADSLVVSIGDFYLTAGAPALI